MLRLNASFSKKVPIAGQDYSSQSYHASIEVEIPDGLSPEQLRDRIHDTFELVRDSVENELGGQASALPAPAQPSQPPPQQQQPAPAPAKTAEAPASARQIRYLTTLALDRGMDVRALGSVCRRDFGVPSVEALSRQQASDLIDRMNDRESGSRQATRRAA
jgi:hypothetical protein